MVALPANRNDRDYENHTRWRHKWEWHNRGHVLDKIAADWAGKEDWMRALKKKSTLADKYQFATFSSSTE